MKRSDLHSDPDKVRQFVQRGRSASARSMSKRGPISPASPAQRLKVRDRVCVNCAAEGCDPAHLTPRGMGGCDSEDCVIPLCRTCHRDFDEGRIDLEPVLALREFRLERSHMAWHGSFEQCIRRLRGERQAA